MMKKYIANILTVISIIVMVSCKKEGNYVGGTPADIIAILDLRPLYKDRDVTLTKESMYGATKLAAVVISDHTAGNLPKGLLIVQDNRRLSMLRGISLEMGDEAEKYHPGDSIQVDIEGGTLTRKNNILTITGVSASKILPKGHGAVNVNNINASQLNAFASDYESSLCVLNKVGLVPAPIEGDEISGNKTINDGFANTILYTNPSAKYAHDEPYGLASYVGIPFVTGDSTVEFRTRAASDIVDLGSSLSQDLIITGILGDPKGGDGGNEYVQMLATTDIDFSVIPYCLVVCNNAGTSTPVLNDGWATGGLRTIGWKITSGKVNKGEFLYWGGQNKKINGPNSTYSFPATAHYVIGNYNGATGATNAGDVTMKNTPKFSNSGPFANSGNASGVALFRGTTITEKSTPEDVLFVGSGGGTSIYDITKNPILGYRICNNDWYSMYSVNINPQTNLPVATAYLYFQSNGKIATGPSGTGNATNMVYATPSDVGYFSMMGGVYNTTLGRWTTARSQYRYELNQANATIDSLEQGKYATQIVE
ncbi:MAG: hypothetical protein DI598_00475 [Pseudopedobacter saltans]|uniref:DUF5689 domain-containing protein n=1 Tax=Pseudopedobacter saltans TaxID=151895 RepID=A0A2W5FE22_9SPHI|nr:MAG: hypothetical protein DI598_00475 [Pseudopedobacter saltans]